MTLNLLILVYRRILFSVLIIRLSSMLNVYLFNWSYWISLLSLIDDNVRKKMMDIGKNWITKLIQPI